jgi:hypothetical protein
LKLYGNQLKYMQTSFIVGNIIGLIPSNIILTRAPAHIWIPINEVKGSAPIQRKGKLLTTTIDNMVGSDIYALPGQECNANICHSLLYRLASRSVLVPISHSCNRPCRRYVLSRNAIYHRILVSKRRTGKANMYFPY